MNIELNNSTPRKVVIKNHLGDTIRTVTISNLSTVDQNIIKAFCSENPFSTVSVPELNLLYTIQISTTEVLGDIKEIFNLKETVEKFTKTKMFLDLFSKLLTED